MYDRQQLLWQKQVIVIGSIDLDSKIDEYHADVAQFQHVLCNRRSVQRQCFAPSSLFFVAEDACSRSFCECFSVANVNSVLSLKSIKIMSYNKCFEKLSLAWQFSSISSPASDSLNTSSEDCGENKWSARHPIALFNVLDNDYVTGLIVLVPAHLPRSHSLQYPHASSAVAALSVDAIFVNYYFVR